MANWHARIALQRAQMIKASAIAGGERSGFTGPFFPPGQPIAPMAPSAAGRAWDYNTGINLTYTPRQQAGLNNLTFATLRRLADPAQGGLDLLRVAIEKRKRQLKLQKWHVVPRDGSEANQRCKDAEAILRKPDGFQSWRTWLGQLLEDHFVIDAPTLYFRDGAQGRVLLELIDGSTIDLLVDDRGRTPMPPLDAYQQILKGLPAVGYTVDELGYYMDNPRPGRLYGMSHVETVATFITISLNRQLSVANYFTAGSIPDMLIGVPETWQPNQLRDYQEWWNSFLAGQLDKRRQAMFIPGLAKPFETKAEILKNDFDEWQARVICWAFDLSPESLVRQTNRATAQTVKESAAEDGLEGTKVYVKEVIDDILLRLGGADLEFGWRDEEIIDPEVKAKVIASYIGGKPIITIQQGREIAGLKPATPEELAEIEAMNAAPTSDGANDPLNTKPANVPSVTVGKAAASRGGRSLPALKKNTKLTARIEKGIAKLARSALGAQKKALLARIETFRKVSGDEIGDLLAELARTPLDDTIIEQLRELLQEMTAQRATDALDSLADRVGGTDDAFARLLTQANERAVEFARDRSGNLVRGIDEASQRFLNEITSSALEGGLTNAELAGLLRDSYGFSDERSMVIARTETAEADGEGRMIGYRASGVVTGKGWDPDAEACPICLDNESDGVIGLDDTFSSGDDHEPAHPNCECSIYPVVEED